MGRYRIVPFCSEIYHLEKGRNVSGGSVKILEQGPLRASLLLEINASSRSKIRQVISLTTVSRRVDFETEVDWDENRQFLVGFCGLEFWDLLWMHGINHNNEYWLNTHYLLCRK
ncbi:hypothetical protein BC937DRAFT_89240 [Endogone sp. FLAS-F59071]|nr:hypothetical protein BC937DRAFT_89240 [Endogone sp. FLAS-F59071]|eukprot:RUS22424.1 hypothetical protein BC937DRAFT_89240 [Endogone sp. FLAS-F59071]